MQPRARRSDLKPPPLFRPRDIMRLVTFGVAMIFILWSMMKASNPRTWRWVIAGSNTQEDHAQRPAGPPAARPASGPDRTLSQFYTGQAVGFLAQFTLPSTSPGSVDAGVIGVLSQEQVPLPEHQPPAAVARIRRAATPVLTLLEGAQDRTGFLIENPDLPEFQTARRDADARYHLLELARDARTADLAADALRDVRYTALRENPDRYRGEVIHIQGQLLWITTLELKRQLPGLDHAYQGIVTVGGADQGYWVIFTELPSGLPPQREWRQLYLNDVQFDGYFLKVLRAEHPSEKGKSLLIPVLVGRTLQLPPPAPPSFDVAGSLRVILIAAGALVLLATLAIWLYRRSERRYEAKMAEVRRRAEAASRSDAASQVPNSPADLPDQPAPGAHDWTDLRLDQDPSAQRNGSGGRSGV